MSPQAKGLLWLAAAGLAAFLTVGGLPRLAKLVPWSWEQRAADALGPSAGGECSGSPEAAALLAGLVRRIDPVFPDDKDFPLSVKVVRDPEINAFASLGGRIYVNDGLLKQAQSADELAGVLAHEIEHVRRRDVIEGFAGRLVTFGALRVLISGGFGAEAARIFLNMSFSRSQERRADEGALERLKAARVSPAGLESFFKRIEGLSSLPPLLSDHPAGADRAELARRYQGGASEAVMSAEQWERLKGICR